MDLICFQLIGEGSRDHETNIPSNQTIPSERFPWLKDIRSTIIKDYVNNSNSSLQIFNKLNKLVI